jgi:hypothetical protein
MARFVCAENGLADMSADSDAQWARQVSPQPAVELIHTPE